MDVRSITISDPDSRVDDRISKLSKEDIGFLNVIRLTQNNDAFDLRGRWDRVRSGIKHTNKVRRKSCF